MFPDIRPEYDESTNPSNGWRAPDAFDAIDAAADAMRIMAEPIDHCGNCGAPLYDERDVYGPYGSARSLGTVCGDCAPFITTGVG
jgi:hypothetical protein